MSKNSGMLGYALNEQGGWRRVANQADCVDGETFSSTQPPMADFPEQSSLYDQMAALREQLSQIQSLINSKNEQTD